MNRGLFIVAVSLVMAGCYFDRGELDERNALKEVRISKEQQAIKDGTIIRQYPVGKVIVFIDPLTSCHYLRFGSGPMVPRLQAGGLQVGCGEGGSE